MTKIKKIFTMIMAGFVALTMAAGVAFLSINCSSEESAKKSVDTVGSIIYAEPSAYPLVNSNSYSSLEDAVAANLSTTEAGQVALQLSLNYTLSSSIEIPDGYYITVDLAGHSIDVSATKYGQAFLVNGTMTLMDSTGVYVNADPSEKRDPGVYDNGNGTYTTVYQMSDESSYDEETGYSYSTYSYTSGGIYGGYYTSNSGGSYGAVRVNAGGNFTMDGGTITGNVHYSGGGIAAYGGSDSRNTFTMNGGSVSGNGALTYGSGIYTLYTDFELYGGIISSNYNCDEKSVYGGGVYENSGTVFYMDQKNDDIPLCVSHNGSSTTKRGAGFYFAGISSAPAECVIAGGHIEFNTAIDSAVYIANYAELEISGGFIGNNTGINSGAAIYCNASSGYDVVMSGGVIYNNEITGTSYGGGGILTYAGTFTLTGGLILNNTSAGYGGGVCVYNGSDFVMTGGEIIGNTASSYGGGIGVFKGTMTIDGGVIKNNKALRSQGGGIYLPGSNSYKISNVLVEGNSSASHGGGIYSTAEAFTLSNSVIRGNSSEMYGGGIFLNTGDDEISDTEITGNYAYKSGGGILYQSLSLALSGEMVIKDNYGDEFTYGEYVKSNVYLYSNTRFITLGALTSGSYIGVTVRDSAQTQITEEETSTERYKTADMYFHLDTDESHFVGYEGGRYLELIDSSKATAMATWDDGTKEYFGSVEGALSIAAADSEEDRGTVTLLKDTEVSSEITIEVGSFVTLDLNGSTITWTGASKSNFFIVYGNFILEDTAATGGEYKGSEEPGVYKIAGTTSTLYMTVYDVLNEENITTRYYYQSGAITGGMATGSTGSNANARGGGVYVGTNAAMVMYGGTLYNNTGTYSGGVYTIGEFTMYGGSVSGNYSQNSSTKHNGAAFLNEGTLYISGGVIYGNTTTGMGYGGAIENTGTMYMYKLGDNPYDFAGLGPVISGNYSSAYGGGIMNKANLYVYAGYITLNEAKTDGGGINNNGGPTYMYGGLVTGNFVSGIGGGVCSPSSFYLYGGYISYNYSTGSYAGGIYMGSTSYFYGGEISHNSASKQGGGVYTVSTLYLGEKGSTSGVKISDNTAGSLGGGIYTTSNLYVYAGEISGNVSSSYGGGIYTTSKLYLYANEVEGEDKSVKISYNTAVTYGGGIYCTSASTITMEGGEISYNSVTGSSSQGGGAAFLGASTMSGGSISYNTSGGYGGGIYIAKVTFTMTGGEISYNTSSRGGAVSVSDKGATFIFENGEISGNTATVGNGGAVYVGNSGTYFTMTGGEISGNYAADNAGGVFGNDNATIKLLGGTISGNFAESYGGGVYFVSSASVEIGGGITITGNFQGSRETYDETNENNLYLISGNKIKIDSDVDNAFTGTIGVTVAAASSVQITNNSFDETTYTDVVLGRVTSDQGYCMGLNQSNSYVYLYEEHDYSIVCVSLEEADGVSSIKAYYYCSRCGEKGEDCSTLIKYSVDEEGNATACVDVEGCTCYGVGADGDVAEGGLSVNTGVLVEDTNGVTWYPDISSALESVSGECAITLLEDLTGDVCLSLSGDTTLDLNGHTIEGNVTASSESSDCTFTITDSVGGGAISGTVSTNGSTTTIKIETTGGSFDAESFENGGLSLSEGYAVLYTEDEEGNGTYTVYLEDEAYGLAEACIERDDASIYFAVIETAIKKVGINETVTLCKNVDMSERDACAIEKAVTIDLDGYVLTANFGIAEGTITSGDNITGSLKITDSSEDLTGRVAGGIRVTGESSGSDGTENSNSFENVLVVAASTLDPNLTVDLEGLKSSVSGVTYFFSAVYGTGEEASTVVSYGITKGHNHVYTIAEAFLDSDGVVKIKVKCSCGEDDCYYVDSSTGGDSGVAVFDVLSSASVNIVENDDGTVTYYYSGIDLSSCASGDVLGSDYSADYTMTPLVKIEIGDEVYYLDENTIEQIDGILASASGEDDVTITLWSDIELSLEISGSATIDLNGHELSGSIEFTSDTTEKTLTVKDSSAEGEDGGAAIGTGVLNSEITASSASNVVSLEGGSYTSTTVGSLETLYGSMENCVPSADAGGDDLDLTLIYNADGGVIVTTRELAAETAAVSIKIDGAEMYFASLQDAINYISENNVKDATVTLLCDLDEDVVIPEGVSVTIDLGGYTIYSDIEVEAGASLTIENKNGGNVEGDVRGEGNVSGGIFVVAIRGGDGSSSVYYYTSVGAAAAALSDGDTITFLADVEDTVYIDILTDGEVTIDLNGKSVAAELTASEKTVLTIKDLGDTTGLYTGTIFGDNVTVESGQYTTDVSLYLAEDATMYVKTDGDGNVTYVVADSGSETAFEGAAVKIVSSEGVVTYYDDIGTAIAHVSFGDTIVLLEGITVEDTDSVLTIDGAGVFTIDLNGKAITGSIEVSGNTSLTITDSTENAVGAVGEVTGSVSVTDEFASLVVEAGIYGENPSAYAAEDKVVLVICGIADTSNTYRVLREDEIDNAAASVTYTDEKGNEITVYFEDISDAIAYACDGGNYAEGTSATVTLCKDVEGDICVTGGSVILDLNGQSVGGDITFETGSFTIVGEGSYTGSSEIAEYLDDGLAAYVTENGTEIVSVDYAIEHAAASVTVDGVTTYFESFEDAVAYVNGLTLDESETPVLTLLDDVEVNGTVVFSNDVVFDLNGHTFTGNVEAGDSAEAENVISFTITDTSEDGDGVFDGSITTNNESEMKVEGGSFTDPTMADYIDAEGYVAIDDGNGGVIIVDKNDAVNVANIIVVLGGDETPEKYFMSLDDAIKYAAGAATSTSATVTILSDIEMTIDTAVEITFALTIDLNGHTAGVNIWVNADGGGSLTVKDSTYVAKTTGAGALTGYVAVVGEEDGSNDGTTETNPYASTVKFINGAAPNGSLTIDLSALGTNGGYYFDAVEFGGDDGSGYGIVMSHVHAYAIEVWTFVEGGEIYLEFMCACGEMLQNVIYTAEVVVTLDSEGNFVFTASVTGYVDENGEPVTDGSGVSREYMYVYTADIAATVTADGNTYYFESLQDALDFASGVDGATVILQRGADEDVGIVGSVTLNLNGFDMQGVELFDGSSLTVTGDGEISGIAIDENNGVSASVKLQGGTYGEEELEFVEENVDRYNGYTVFVNADGTVTVMTENEAKLSAAASVTDENGNITYYESFSDAADAIEEGSTITLYVDASDETLTINVENVTVDLNGFSLGELIVTSGGSATVTGEGSIGDIEAEDNLTILGGTYTEDDLELLEKLISGDSGYSIVVGQDGYYTVLPTDEAEDRTTLKVTYYDEASTATVILYFEDMQTGLSAAAQYSGTATLTGNYSGDIEISGGLTLDLAGYDVEGYIEVSGEAEVSVLDLVGSSTAFGVTTEDGSSVALYGGTYYEDVGDYLASGYVAVVTIFEEDEAAYTMYSVMSVADAGDASEAYVEFEDGSVGYYASADEALKAAIENGGTVVLTSDVDLGEVSITTDVKIDLNGYILTGDLTIEASTGSLKVTDSSTDGAGSIEGTITITDCGTEKKNEYSETLVFDGTSPNGALEIDLSSLNPSDSETVYVFTYDDTTGTYFIDSYLNHNHVYDIAVWEYDYETGCVTVRFMCACGMYYGEEEEDGGVIITDVISDVSVMMNGDGTASVTCSYGDYECSITINVAASVTGEDGETYYFESLEKALEYACEYNGTVVLNDDFENVSVVIEGDSDITIDLAGHSLEGSIYVEEGSSLKVTDTGAEGAGNLEASLNIEGGFTLDGASMTLTEDSAVGDSGAIYIKDSAVDLDGNTLSGVSGLEGEIDVYGDSGSAIVLNDDVDMDDGEINVHENLTLDIAGNDFEGTINVDENASLTVKDSDGSNSGNFSGEITVSSDSAVSMEDGTYTDEVKINLPEDMVIQSSTDSNGEASFGVVSKYDHEGMGHGLDEVVGWTFNPETSTVTITFECMSDGEITVKTVAISEANYTTTVYDGYVHVEYDFESTVAADNGTSYPFHVCGDDVDIEALPDGEDDDYYSYSVASRSTCEAEGEDVYTYGRGRGVIVRVTTPKDHDWEKKEYDMDGMTFTYYECRTCQKIVLNEGDEDEYDDANVLAGDIAAKESYEEARRDALAALDDAMTEILENLAESFEEGSDEYEAIKEVVEAMFSEYKDFIEGTGYESQTGGGSEDYLNGLIGDIEGIIDEAVLNATQTSTEMSTDYILDVLYQEIIESGKYEGSALDELDGVFEELKRDLERITVESVDEIAGLYDSFIERAEAALDAVIPSTAFTTEDSEVAGSVSSSEGLSSSVGFEITAGDASKVVVDMDSYVYVGDGDYSDEYVASLVEGKGVAAVFDISLYDSASGTYVTKYKGYYEVRISLDEDILAMSGLQVVYIGSDGRAEVYGTEITDDGYLVFTTTHFSEFLLLSSDVEVRTGVDERAESYSYTDGMTLTIIIVLAVIIVSLVVLAIVFACVTDPRKRNV